MKTRVLALLLALAVASPAAFAAGSETDEPANAINADYQAGKQAVERKDWPAAVASFRKVVAAQPTNPDGFNMLGFSLRWTGKLDEALAAYDKALQLDPKHRGALEYSGVAYLKAGNPDKARAQLVRLEQIGAKSSEEYRDLAKAIADYNAGKR